jgi:hypothetical protein
MKYIRDRRATWRGGFWAPAQRVMAAPARSLGCRSLADLVPIGAVAPPRARAGGTHHAGHGSDPDRLL